MLDNEAWDNVAERVIADDFYLRSHRIIFSSMQGLISREKPIDLVTLSELLEQTGELQQVGGFPYLLEIQKNTPSSANILAYADIVRERAVVREMIGVANEIAESGFDTQGRSSNELLDMAESKVFKIAEKRTNANDGPKGIGDILNRTLDRIEFLSTQTNHNGVTGVSTGYHDLDRMTTGLQPSDLIIVAARPSMGKCIVAGSRVMDPQSGALHVIDDLVKNGEANVFSLNNDFKLRSTRPSAFVDDGYKPVFRVTTALGREIETTITHPFLTGEGWKPLAHIDVGERVAVPRKLDAFGNSALPEHEIKLLAYMLADGGTTDTNPKFTNGNPRVLDEFRHCVEQFGGVRCSSSLSLNRTPSVRVRACEKSLLERRQIFATRLRESMQALSLTARQVALLSGVVPSATTAWLQGKSLPNSDAFKRLSDGLGVTAEGLLQGGRDSAGKNDKNRFTAWLQQHQVMAKSALHKSVPKDVFKLPRAQLALFLNRLFCCDGSIFVQNKRQVALSYASSSKALARDVQHLLLRFGVLARLREKQVKYKGSFRSACELVITHRQSINTFINEIGIFGKEERVETARAVLGELQESHNLDSLPDSAIDYIRARKGSRSWASLFTEKGEVMPNGFNPHLSAGSRRRISRNKAAEYARLLDDEYLQNLASSDLYWDEVVKIEPLGSKQVYDLSVPDTHNFVAEDILVHNTTFAMNLAEHAALNEDKPVVIFSLEMPAEQIMMRMLASLSRVNQTKVRTGNLDDDDWARISSTMGMLNEKNNMYIDDGSGLTPTEVRSRSRRIAREHGGVSMIMVDYLQLMTVPGMSENRTLEIAEISRSLKALAKELKCPVVALSQLNRSLEQRSDKRPVNSDLRESGSIEQDADVIMFIYRDEVYHPDGDKQGLAEIILGKQRNGPIGSVELKFHGALSRFDNYARADTEDDY
ncbi:replicative DNA helicase [Aliidiomarina soli]|uniref:Replicative DNA helicase n=2 Tax=Aliidiomarina soli TaxID=1928574 RepID=A0A432WDH9_9GAMM|nr:replicative DNA helicase [Aliidiomarina soli]